MAERQMHDQPLTEDEYALIQTYGGVIEHPIVALEGSVRSDPSHAGLGRPTPLAKIVPILQTGENGPFWQAALGQPRSVTAVLHERGQRSVAIGAWSSFFEHVGPPIDDNAWRGMVTAAKRPAWVTVDE